MKETLKLLKFNNLNYYYPYHAKLSNLQLPTFVHPFGHPLP